MRDLYFYGEELVSLGKDSRTGPVISFSESFNHLLEKTDGL